MVRKHASHPPLAGIRAGGSTRAAFPEAEASSGREHERRCVTPRPLTVAGAAQVGRDPDEIEPSCFPFTPGDDDAPTRHQRERCYHLSVVGSCRGR
jgi:hypothetical protein